MTKRSTVIAAILASVLALGAASPSLAFGIKARLDSVFVVGDQIFEGGEISLRSVSRGDLVVLEVDGTPVALLSPDFRGRRPGDATPRLIFQRDERGFLHFAYVAYESKNGPGRQTISFRVTALARGLATLPDYAPYGETLYLARR